MTGGAFNEAEGRDALGPETFRVFVYGTLRYGHGNHSLLGPTSVFEGVFDSQPGWVMYSLGGFPAIVRQPDGGTIRGEVYRVNALTKGVLDRLEGVAGGHYIIENIVLDDGSEAMAYTQTHRANRFFDHWRVATGDWDKFDRARWFNLA